jgi:hypothetical protein
MAKVEGKWQYRVEVSNRPEALENLEAEVDINRAWETIRENIKIAPLHSPPPSSEVNNGGAIPPPPPVCLHSA